MTRFFAAAILLTTLSAAAQTAASTQPASAPPPSVTATPTFSQSPIQSFPRVSGLDDKAIEAQVNKQLANRERADRASRADCLRAYISHGKPSYSELIRLAYLSPRLLSIDVRTSYLCGSPYPNDDIPYPVTFDLTTGRELDWHLFFTDEFLNPPADRPSLLLNLYLRHAPPSEDCSDVVNDRNLTFAFWLDSARHSLMVRPNLSHVSQACATIAAIPFAEVQSQIRNPLDRQDLLPTPPLPSK